MVDGVDAALAAAAQMKKLTEALLDVTDLSPLGGENRLKCVAILLGIYIKSAFEAGAVDPEDHAEYIANVFKMVQEIIDGEHDPL